MCAPTGMQNFAVTKVQWPYFLWVQIVRLLGTAPGIPVLQCKLLKEKRFLGSSYIGAGCGERGHTNLMIGSWFEQQTPKWGNLKRDSCVCVCMWWILRFRFPIKKRSCLTWERRKKKASSREKKHVFAIRDDSTTRRRRRCRHEELIRKISKK